MLEDAGLNVQICFVLEFPVCLPVVKLAEASLRGVRVVNVARGCHNQTPEYVLQKTENFLEGLWECVLVWKGRGEAGERRDRGQENSFIFKKQGIFD